MKNESLANRVAVCSWSLQPTSPADLVAKLEKAGFRRIQLALDPLRDAPKVWGKAASLFQKKDISMVSGMFGCVGEDYSTLHSIRLTGGIAPDRTWEQNWNNMRATAALAHELGLKLVTFHAGFLPHEQKDPRFARMKRRLAEAADVFNEAGIALGLETGQETAPVLVQLLKKLNCPNVGVNFDPANMILYDKGNPVEAVRLLGPWIRQVHIKDARRTKVPGTWGQEVAVGTGQVDWRAFFTTLRELDYAGDFVIEREAGGKRLADIRTARDVVTKLGDGAK